MADRIHAPLRHDGQQTTTSNSRYLTIQPHRARTRGPGGPPLVDTTSARLGENSLPTRRIQASKGQNQARQNHVDASTELIGGSRIRSSRAARVRAAAALSCAAVDPIGIEQDHRSRLKAQPAT